MSTNIHWSSTGSILGPVLFNIYVSSLTSCLKFNSIQYADDASLYLSNFIRNIQSTISILETDIKNLNKWPENSCLVLNDYKILSVLHTFKRTAYDRNYSMKSNSKSISKSQLVNKSVSPLIAI